MPKRYICPVNMSRIPCHQFFFSQVLLPYFHKSLKPFIHRGFSYGSNYGSKMVVSVYCHSVFPFSNVPSALSTIFPFLISFLPKIAYLLSS